MGGDGSVQQNGGQDAKIAFAMEEDFESGTSQAACSLAYI